VSFSRSCSVFKRIKLKFFKKRNNPTFVFPYSNDVEVKKYELIQNLEKGILLEDTKEFLDWRMSFKDLEPYCSSIEEKGDRFNYYLGEHTILDGLDCHLTVMRWIYNSKSNPFSQVDFFLGFDSIAIKKLKEIEDHITQKIGEPTKKESWSGDEMIVKWKFKYSNITLITWERFAIHGMLHIGLNENNNRI
jgi:hypothetical protein